MLNQRPFTLNTILNHSLIDDLCEYDKLLLISVSIVSIVVVKIDY
jgi:hypothetical protein